MKSIRAAAFLATLSLILTAPLSAALINHEGFDYPPGNINSSNGGQGWSTGWTGQNPAVQNQVIAPGLSFPGLLSSGNRFQTVGINTPSFRPFGSRFGVDGTELWLSFLIRREVNFPNGGYGGLSLYDGSTAEQIFIGIPAGAVTTHWSVQRINPRPASIAAAVNAPPIVGGETTLLVLRLRFNGVNDQVELFVNPLPGAPPTTADATLLNANYFFDRVRLASGAGLQGVPTPVSFDEIRLGETYADVTPPPTQPGPAIGWLREGPQRMTAGAKLTLPLRYVWPDGDPSTLHPTLTVTSDNEQVLPAAGITISGTGADRRVELTPATAGSVRVTATVTPPPTGPPVTASFDLTILPTPDGLLAHEPFDYPPPRQSLVGKNGGVGFAGAWYVALPWGSPNQMFAEPPPTLTFSELATSGGRAQMTSGSAGIVRPTELPLGEDGTVRYFSLLLRPDSFVAANSYFGLLLMSTRGVDVFAGKPGGGSPNFVLENAGGAGQVPTAIAPVRTQTALLVVKLESRPGPDRVSLFVNPPLGTEPAVPNAVKEDIDLGLLLGPAFSAGNISWSVDELRVGTTFASVTPPATTFHLQEPNQEPNFPDLVEEHKLVTWQIKTVDPLPIGALRFELIDDLYGAQIDPVTGIFTWTPAEEPGPAERIFTVRATSNANPTTTDEVTFFIDVMEGNLPPQLEPIPDQTVPRGSSFLYQLVATDSDRPEQIPLTYEVVSGPQGLYVTIDGELRWTPTPAQAGAAYPVTVRVTDRFAAQPGQTERTFTLTTAAGRQAKFAYWIGPADGAWNNPANWDLGGGRWPNNTATEEFLVSWSAHPVTITVPEDVSVTSFSWITAGTLNLQTPNFVIEDSLSWTGGGTIAGAGAMTVHGRADLSVANALTLKDQAQLILKDSELETILQFDGSARLVIAAAGTLAVADGGEFNRTAGTPEIHNHGTIRIWNTAPKVPFILFRNYGTVVVFSHTLDLLADGSGTGMYQESGGSFDLGGGIGSPANILGKVSVKDGSRLFGEANITQAQIDGTVQGRMQFDQLSFGSTAVIKYEITGPQDIADSTEPLKLVANSAVTLAGRLEVSLRPGYTPGPNDQFAVLEATGGVTGGFMGAPFGRRIQLSNGRGSMLLTQDGHFVILTRFLPRAESLGEQPLIFQLPAVRGEAGGGFIAPHPAYLLPPGNWAGGRVEVEITVGFEPAHDFLAFRTNPTFSISDEITFEGETVLFRRKAFGTARIVEERRKMICDLYPSAENEAVVALLGHVYYGNSELQLDWFTTAEARYPEREIEVTFTAADGVPSIVNLNVSFPYLVGLVLEDSLQLPEHSPSVLRLQGQFSNGQTLPVRKLETTWDDSACGVLVSGAEFRGEQNVVGKHAPYCCLVYATAGHLETRIAVYEGQLRRGSPTNPAETLLQIIAAVFIDDDDSPCAAFRQFLYVYRYPDCPAPRAARVAAAAADNDQPHVQSPTALYALEALMKETAGGRRLVDIYRQHTAEVVRMFLQHPSLFTQAQELVTAYHPGVIALLAGKGDEVAITPAMISQVNAFWNALASYASPALKAVLVQEQVRFDNFQRFQGASFSSWASMLDIAVPTQPRFHISLTLREANRFLLALNDVPGTSVVLWRSLDLKTWAQVNNATIERDGVNLIFIDPTPPATEAFYKVSH